MRNVIVAKFRRLDTTEGELADKLVLLCLIRYCNPPELIMPEEFTEAEGLDREEERKERKAERERAEEAYAEALEIERMTNDGYDRMAGGGN